MDFFAKNIILLRKRRKLTQSDVAKNLNLTRSTVNNLENKNSHPSVTQLMAFSQFFHLAIDTLLKVDLGQVSESQFTELAHGSDVYLKGTNERVIPIQVNQNNEDLIEYVPEKAKAGYSTGFADREYIEQLPHLTLPFLSKSTKYRAFQISGDSMLPIPDGAIVIGQYVENFFEIKSDNPYIIVTREDGIVFKQVENQLQDKRQLLLSSLNTLYEPYALHASNIIEIWSYAGYYTDEFPRSLTTDEHMLKMLSDIKKQMETK